MVIFRCKKHPRYQAIKAPKSQCNACKVLYSIVKTMPSLVLREKVVKKDLNPAGKPHNVYCNGYHDEESGACLQYP